MLFNSSSVMAGRVTQSSRQSPQQSDQSRARWTNGLTKIFVDAMVVQVQRGNRLNNCFSAKAWKLMCDEFYQKTGLKWDREQLKSKYTALKKHYTITRSLLDQNEFSLDEATGSIMASNAAWAEYIKAHPDSEPIKSSGCALYKELCKIFSEPEINGKHDCSAEQKDTLFSFFNKEPLNTAQEESSSESEEVDDTGGDKETLQPAGRDTTSNRKRGRRGVDDAMAAAILQMAATTKLRTAALRQINAKYSIADCIRKLDEMHGLEEEVYFAALELFNKPVAREIFLSLKSNKCLIWLHNKCGCRGLTGS